jgi:hypothetical protein
MILRTVKIITKWRGAVEIVLHILEVPDSNLSTSITFLIHFCGFAYYHRGYAEIEPGIKI